MIPTSISRRDDDETIGGFEAESGLRTGLIPGFSVGANETSGGAAGIISSGVSAGEGATAAAAALEAEQRKWKHGVRSTTLWGYVSITSNNPILRILPFGLWARGAWETGASVGVNKAGPMVVWLKNKKLPWLHVKTI